MNERSKIRRLEPLEPEADLTTMELIRKTVVAILVTVIMTTLMIGLFLLFVGGLVEIAQFLLELLF